MKESYVFLADGFEELEAISVIDILKRAEMPVKTVSIGKSLQVTGAHGVVINADMLLDSALPESPRWMILPGGMPGATNLYDCAPLQEMLRRQAESEDGMVAAICASPAVVLGQMGLLRGEKATCYPGFETMLDGAEVIDAPVVRSGRFILGNGPGNAVSWALAIVACELGGLAASHVAGGMLLYPGNEDDVDHYFG